MKSNIYRVEFFDDDASGYTFFTVFYRSGVERWHTIKTLPRTVLTWLPDTMESNRIKKATRPGLRYTDKNKREFDWFDRTVYIVFPESVME